MGSSQRYHLAVETDESDAAPSHYDVLAAAVDLVIDEGIEGVNRARADGEIVRPRVLIASHVRTAVEKTSRDLVASSA
jgi:hypothetical protein